MTRSGYEQLRGQGPAAFAVETGRRRYWDALERHRESLIDPATGQARAGIVERVSCAACLTDDPVPCFTKGGFQYVRCRRCGTLYTNPQLRQAELLRFWQESDAADTWAEVLQHPAQVEYDRAKFDRLLDELSAESRPGRLLDVGCGTGLFLDRARARGWDVVGVEPGAAARGIARSTYGLEVHPAIEDVAGTFDLITSWEVLEHIKDPAAALRTVRSQARSACRFVALVGGNGASLANRIMQARSAAFDFPRYWYFTPASFDGLLERTGWTPGRQQPLLDEMDVVHRYLSYGDPYGEPFGEGSILPGHLLQALREHALGHGMAYKFISLART
jgi:SAM-dependent methyltransferase